MSQNVFKQKLETSLKYKLGTFCNLHLIINPLHGSS